MRWLKHAFAVEPPGAAEPNEQQRAVVDRLCREIVRRRLTAPALMFLEMSQPLNYLAAQTMHFFTPLASCVLDAEGLRQLAGFLEQRGAVDYIVRRIEALEE